MRRPPPGGVGWPRYESRGGAFVMREGGISIDTQTLAEVMGNPAVDYARYTDAVNNALIAAGCTTVDRAAMFVAQVGHESEGLRWFVELWGPTADQLTYDGRMGNGPGEGYTYRGRGPIQLTGKDNYRSFTNWARREGHTDLDFVAQPDLVAEPYWGFLAASYYWTAARPNLNKWADDRNLLNASREINGWVTTPNGMADRRRRYGKALSMGERLLPKKTGDTMEKVLDYSRDQVWQDTFYNCGPASVQTVVKSATGEFFTESELGNRLNTHTGGTDWIGQFPAVLNHYIPDAEYTHREMPNDPPAHDQKEQLWTDVVGSIDAGHGVVANIVAPPNNYPKAVAPSTIDPAYGGGTVYHYVAVMGYGGSGAGRRYWVADSGFSPYGYWISHDQLASLIPPKGYAYSTAPAVNPAPTTGGSSVTTTHWPDGPAALNDTKVNTQKILEQMAGLQEQIDQIGTLLNIVVDQLCGPGRDENGLPTYSGWPQLGQNAAGADLSLVDGVSAGRHDLAALAGVVTSLADALADTLNDDKETE